jgi:hypothetical protein
MFNSSDWWVLFLGIKIDVERFTTDRTNFIQKIYKGKKVTIKKRLLRRRRPGETRINNSPSSDSAQACMDRLTLHQYTMPAHH